MPVAGSREKGYDPKMGARPMARTIQEHIKRPLAEELLFGRLVGGGSVRVSVAKDGTKLELECNSDPAPGSDGVKKSVGSPQREVEGSEPKAPPGLRAPGRFGKSNQRPR